MRCAPPPRRHCRSVGPQGSVKLDHAPVVTLPVVVATILVHRRAIRSDQQVDDALQEGDSIIAASATGSLITDTVSPPSHSCGSAASSPSARSAASARVSAREIAVAFRYLFEREREAPQRFIRERRARRPRSGTTR